jgi:ferric-dicitrate binding protein FerR (iron transport regulator)
MTEQPPESAEKGVRAGADLGFEFPEAEALRVASSSDLGDALRRLADGGTGHLPLADLQNLAERRRLSQDWQMPEHLATCPACLDLFCAILDGVPRPSAAATRRFVSVFDEVARPAVQRLLWPTLVLRAAAAALIVASACLAYRQWTGRHPPSVAGGRIEWTGGREVAQGAALPAQRRLIVREAATVAFSDGTSVAAVAGSVFAFSRGTRGGPIFDVERGEVLVTAARQPAGSTLAVRTALGTIRVVGTVFRVTAGAEDVVVHERCSDAAEPARYSASISRVTVAVTEGIVSVESPHEKALVAAGHSAVLRQGQRWIEVR